MKARNLMLAAVLVALFLVASLPQIAQAAASTWSGASSNVWGTGGNWDTLPATGDSLIFTSATGVGGLNLNNNLTSGSFSVAGITFNAGSPAYVIGNGTTTANSGNTFVLTGNVLNSGTSLETINCPFSMAAVRTFTTASGGGDITLGGNISGSGGGISKAGGGTLYLSGTNTYTGATTVSAGTLRFTSGGSLNTAGTITVGGSSGPTLNITGGSVTTTSSSSSAVLLGGSQPGYLTLGTGGSLSLTNASGRMIVGNSAVGRFTQTGGTFSQASTGNLYIGNQGGSSGSFIDVSGGTFTTGAPLVVGVRSNASLTVSGNATVSVGKLEFGYGQSNTLTGTVNLNGGTLRVSYIEDDTANTTSNFNFNGGTLQAKAASTTFMQGLTRANVRDGGAVIDSVGYAITIGQALLHSNIADDAATDGGLTKLGSGTLTLSNAGNTYTGPTTISAGTLKLGSAGTFANSPLIDLADGTTLDLTAKSSGFSLGSSQTLKGTGTVSMLSGQTLTILGHVQPGHSTGQLIVDGDLTLSGTYDAEVVATGSGSADLLNVSGIFNIDAATLALSLTGTLDDPAYVIAQYGSLGGSTKVFSTVTGMPSNYYVNYAYGAGSNQIALVVIPEPATLVLLGMALLALLIGIRRRRK